MDNLISRQAAIDLVRDVCDAILSGCGSHYDGEDEVYDDLLEVDAILKCNKEIRIALQNMLPAEPERIRGKWLELDISDAQVGEWQSMKCSVCGRYHTTPYMYYPTWYAYCPHCGADMREDQDEQYK